MVLCLLFVRYVVFQPAEDIDQDEWQRRRDERRKVGLVATDGCRADSLEGLAFDECCAAASTEPDIGQDGIRNGDASCREYGLAQCVICAGQSMMTLLGDSKNQI